MSQIETEPRREAPSAATSKRDWTRIALSLVLVTMAYNLVEAGLALWSGISARSVVLIGFGLDSVIECAAAGVLLWRLRLEWRGVDREALEGAERRVHRSVGATFFALAAYVTDNDELGIVPTERTEQAQCIPSARHRSPIWSDARELET